MEQTSPETLQLSVIETSVMTEVLVELQSAMTKHPAFPTIHHGIAVIDEEFTEAKIEAYKRKVCGPCLRKEMVQLAAMAIRFLLDLKPGAVDAATIELANKFGVKPADLRDALVQASESGKPVAIPKNNGGRHHVLPIDTGVFNSRLVEGVAVEAKNGVAFVATDQAAVIARGPIEADDLPTVYDAPGG